MEVRKKNLKNLKNLENLENLENLKNLKKLKNLENLENKISHQFIQYILGIFWLNKPIFTFDIMMIITA